MYSGVSMDIFIFPSEPEGKAHCKRCAEKKEEGPSANDSYLAVVVPTVFVVVTKFHRYSFATMSPRFLKWQRQIGCCCVWDGICRCNPEFQGILRRFWWNCGDESCDVQVAA